MTPTAHYDKTYDQYAALPGHRWSSLFKLDTSPLAYKYHLDNPDAGNTQSRVMLRAIHCAILEPDLFDSQYFEFNGKRAGKTYDAALNTHPRMEALKGHEWRKCRAMWRACHQSGNSTADTLLTFSKHEVTLVWEGNKARADIVQEPAQYKRHHGYLADLKTVGSIDPHQIRRQCEKLGWHGQLAHYSAGFEAVYGVKPGAVYLICIEDKAPHDIGVFPMHRPVGDNDGALYAGELLRNRLLAKLRACEESGVWPGRLPEPVDLELGHWAFDDGKDGDQ